MGRFRNYYDRFNTSDPMVRIIAVAALVLVAAIILPRFLPFAGSGLDCQALPEPWADGSRQSWLAGIKPSQEEDLRLDLVLSKTRLTLGEGLTLEVRFINDGIAPMTLFLVPQSGIFRYNQEEIGILIFLQNLGNNQVLGEGADRSPVLAARLQYSSRELEYLAPKLRCTVRIDLSAARLQTAGMGAGNYRVAVLYRNRNKGNVPGIANALTPTPTFPDQGVWTGTVQSQFVSMEVVPAQ
jgi:hypothetical protein